jgi:hypothetical protein
VGDTTDPVNSQLYLMGVISPTVITQLTAVDLTVPGPGFKLLSVAASTLPNVLSVPLESWQALQRKCDV